MKKPIIAIDIDDVLADSTEALRLVVNKAAGVNLSREHYRVPGEYHQYYERVWEQHNLTDKVLMAELLPQMERDQSHISPYVDAKETLKTLQLFYDFVIVTARDLSWEQATHGWLDTHYPNVFSKVLFGGSTDQGGRKTKGQLCLESGASWLIDDNIEHCNSAKAVGIQAVLFGDYGWHYSIEHDIETCKDWKAVERFFNDRYRTG